MVLSIGQHFAQQEFARRFKSTHAVLQLTGVLEPLQTGMLWHDIRAFAFAGIGRPKKFFETLRGTGASVVMTRSFGDHEILSGKLLQRMEFEAAKVGAQLVTTEKDAVRLPNGWQQKVITFPVRLEIDDEEALIAAMLEVARPEK